PPSEDGGELGLGDRFRLVAGASTEPPSEDGGELSFASASSPSRRSLQRSRRPKTAESRRRRPIGGRASACFNGAAVRRRRRATSPGRSAAWRRGFNGAAVRRRRRA